MDDSSDPVFGKYLAQGVAIGQIDLVKGHRLAGEILNPLHGYF